MLPVSVHQRWKRVSTKAPRPVRQVLVRYPPDGVATSQPTAVAEASPSLNDGEIAWQIAAEITDRCSRRDKAAIYLTLGCGDNFDAIVQMLAVVRRDAVALSDGLKARLSRWLEGYAGTAHEAPLRMLLTETSRHHQ